MFCPLTQQDCRKDCAWYRKGECAFKDAVDQIEDMSISLKLLQNAIRHANDCKGY